MQLSHARRHCTVNFAHHDGTAIAVKDFAGRNPIGPEIDEGTHGAMRSDNVGNDLLAKAVLQRKDVAAFGQMRRKCVAGLLGMKCFYR